MNSRRTNHMKERIKRHINFRTFTLTVFCLIVSTAPAYAYIDPGSGAMLLQMLLAALAGGFFFLRNTIRSIMSKIFGFSKGGNNSETEAKGGEGSKEDGPTND